jgi:hypothetical protein
MSDYEVIDADLARACDEVTAVWGNTIGWPGRQDEMFRGYYLQYPDAHPILKLLRHVPSGETVGVLGVGPRRVRWNSGEIRAGMLSHLCVRPDHRKIQPPMLLVRAAIDACHGSYDVVYAMPRTSKSVAFAKLSGMPWACDIKRYVRILRHGHYARRVLPRPLADLAGGPLDAMAAIRDAASGRKHPGLEAEWVTRADIRMEALWRETAETTQAWSAMRDIAMLRWRFDALPAVRRRYLLLSDRATGRLVAWFACDTNGHDEAILMVQDFWGAGTSGSVDRASVRALCREARVLGFAAVEMRLSGPDAVMEPWRREHFTERNRYPVFAHWLNADLASRTAAGFRMTELDNDG